MTSNMLLIASFVTAKRKSFESKRKLHYNEFQAVKWARKLMEQDEDEVEEAEEEEEEANAEPDSTSQEPGAD